MRIVILAAAVLIMNSCKPADQAEAPANQPDDQAMNYAAEIAKMPRRSRDATLFRAIRDAGLPCQKIIDSQPMPNANPPDTSWRAQCENKAYHLINIKPDGRAIVVSRTAS